MNIREGMRRLGILLGAAGGLLGGVLAYGEARSLWTIRTAHLRFESVMAKPTMQRVAKAARDYQNGPWVKYRSEETSNQVDYEKNGTIWELVPEKRKLPPSGAVPDFDQWLAKRQRADELKAAGAILVSVNLDGIKQVTVDKAGITTSVGLSDGEWIARVEAPAPHATAFLLLLLYPVVGFLLPWSCIRILTWVGTGFAAPRG